MSNVDNVVDQLQNAISEGNVEDVEKIILTNEIPMNNAGPSLLNFAISCKQVQVAKCLIKLGTVNIFSETPLHIASLTGREDMVKMLIQEGAPIDAVNRIGQTALHVAVVFSHRPTPIVKVLVENGADIDLKDNYGDSALHISVKLWKNDYSLYLMRNGASLKIKDVDGMNPIESALPEPQMLKYLLYHDHNS